MLLRKVRFAHLAAAALATNGPATGRILLVRHGETNFNADGRLQGRLESQLTDTGHSQASALGEWLARAEAGQVTRVFVSPRRRTRETLANIEAGHEKGLPAPEVRPGLREIELTMWEGQHRTELKDANGADDMERWKEWKAHPSSFVFKEDGHAPLGDLKRRAAEEWAALVAATPPDTTSLVVAHGAFNRVLVQTALGLAVDDFGFGDKHFAFDNCATVELLVPAGAAHASAWRKRYPSESEWMSQEEEVERRRREEGSPTPTGGASTDKTEV